MMRLSEQALTLVLSDDGLADDAIAAEADADEDDARASENRWRAADDYYALSERGWTQLRIAKRVGKSQQHISFCQFCVGYYPGSEERPPFNVAYKEAKKHRVRKNAAGAHEGVELSDGDASGDGWKLLLGDMRERFTEIPDGSIDLIVTDPPYPREYLPLWKDLGEHSARVLRKGGVLLARSGHLFLPDTLAMLSEHLDFGWIYSEPLPGSNVRFVGRKIAVSWQPWLAFSRGPWPSERLDWHPDTLAESPRVKERYVWEQKWQVAAELIATFAQSGHDVLDPFAGSGSYGEAALSVGCRWIGIEIDPVGHAAAARRLRDLP